MNNNDPDDNEGLPDIEFHGAFLDRELRHHVFDAGKGKISVGIQKILRADLNRKKIARRLATESTVQFPPGRQWMTPNGDVAFEATLKDETHECVVSRETLEDHCGAKSGSESDQRKSCMRLENALLVLPAPVEQQVRIDAMPTTPLGH